MSSLISSLGPRVALASQTACRHFSVSMAKALPFSSNGRKPGSRIGDTSVFVQTGLKIRELPLVVKKVNDVLNISGMDKFNEPLDINDKRPQPVQTEIKIDANAQELINGFNRCVTVSGIFRLLETIPMEDVTPAVAIHALKKIIDLENCSVLRNPGILDPYEHKDGRSNETFLRSAFINMLLDIVYQCKDPRIILEVLQVLSRDNFQSDQKCYKDRIIEETLVLIADSVFSLKQVCKAVVILSDFYPDKKHSHELTDKLWSGILDNSDQINDKTISYVVSTLPHFKASRDIVLRLVEDRIGNYWQRYKTPNILEMLKVLTEINCANVKILSAISHWWKVQVHTLTESEMLAIVFCFHKLDYVDGAIIQTLEKYMKARGCQIKEPDLVATICDYCLESRIRVPNILEGVSEYFIEHGHKLSTPQIFSLTRIFGELNHHPENGFKFWEMVETVLERKFSEFPPKEIINLLLSFIYIEKYPLNFVRKLFNPLFMDRLHSQTHDDVMYSRLQLKLFDACMELESKNYAGPYLPSDNTMIRERSTTVTDLKWVSLILVEITRDVERVKQGLPIASLPRHPIFFADLVVFPTAASSILRFGQETDNKDVVIVLIHGKEQFVIDESSLTGLYVMQSRILRKLGFKVMELKQRQLARLRMFPEKLREYVSESYYRALSES